jgi:hypothetical protein
MIYYDTVTVTAGATFEVTSPDVTVTVLLSPSEPSTVRHTVHKCPFGYESENQSLFSCWGFNAAVRRYSSVSLRRM